MDQDQADIILAELDRERQRLMERIAIIDEMEQNVHALVNSDTLSSTDQVQPSTITDAVLVVLRRAGRPMTVKAIEAKIIAKGYRQPDKNLYNSIYCVMTKGKNKDKYYKVGPSLFRLVGPSSLPPRAATDDHEGDDDQGDGDGIGDQEPEQVGPHG